MSNIELPSNDGLLFKIFVTDEMKDFTKKINKDTIKYKVGLCKAGFFSTEISSDLCGERGPMGWRGCTGKIDLPMGCTGMKPKKELPLGDSKNFILKFNIGYFKNEDIDDIKKILSSLTISSGGTNNKYSLYNITQNTKAVIIKYGMKKTPLFLDVYDDFKRNMDITELELMSYGTSTNSGLHNKNYEMYNPDFSTEEEFNEDNSNLYINSYDAKTYVSDGFSRVNISLLNQDLTEDNAKLLLKVMNH